VLARRSSSADLACSTAAVLAKKSSELEAILGTPSLGKSSIHAFGRRICAISQGHQQSFEALQQDVPS